MNGIMVVSRDYIRKLGPEPYIITSRKMCRWGVNGADHSVCTRTGRYIARISWCTRNAARGICGELPARQTTPKPLHHLLELSPNFFFFQSVIPSDRETKGEEERNAIPALNCWGTCTPPLGHFTAEHAAGCPIVTG